MTSDVLANKEDRYDHYYVFLRLRKKQRVGGGFQSSSILRQSLYGETCHCDTLSIAILSPGAQMHSVLISIEPLTQSVLYGSLLHEYVSLIPQKICTVKWSIERKRSITPKIDKGSHLHLLASYQLCKLADLR